MKRITLTETAKMIRKSLKATFPGVKFSTRSKSYSGGASITIEYVDGPAYAAVQEVADRFAGATFDPMQDLKEARPSVVSREDGTIEEVRFGADYVFVRRELSDEGKARIGAAICEEFGIEFPGMNGNDFAANPSLCANTDEYAWSLRGMFERKSAREIAL